MSFTVKSVKVSLDVPAWSKDLNLDVVLIDENGKAGKAKAKYEHAARINYSTKQRVTIDKPYRWSDGDAHITSLSEAKGLKERILEVAKAHIDAFLPTDAELKDIASGKFSYLIEHAKNYSGDEVPDRLKMTVTSAKYAKHNVTGEMEFTIGAEHWRASFEDEKQDEEEKLSCIERNSHLKVLGAKDVQDYRTRLDDDHTIRFGQAAKSVVEEYIKQDEFVRQLLEYRVQEKEKILKSAERDVVNAQSELERHRKQVSHASTQLQAARAKLEAVNKSKKK